MKPLASVIVPSYNSAQTIEHTLNGLLRQTAKIPYEIIVIDSSDDTVTHGFLQGFHPDRIRLLHLNDKTIPAIARNIGVAHAAGEVVLFIDADAYPASDWLEQIMLAYEAGCHAGGGSVLIPDYQSKRLVPLAQYYLQFNEYLDVGEIREKHFVPSCNLFCNRELFNRVGGFPDIRASEDVLFGLKVGKQAKVWFLPKARIFHIFREELHAYLDNQRLLGEYIFIYRKLHYNSFIYRGLIPILVLPLISSIKLMRIGCRIWKAGSQHRREFLKALPVFLLGYAYWNYGFAQGCLHERRK